MPGVRHMLCATLAAATCSLAACGTRSLPGIILLPSRAPGGKHIYSTVSACRRLALIHSTRNSNIQSRLPRLASFAAVNQSTVLSALQKQGMVPALDFQHSYTQLSRTSTGNFSTASVAQERLDQVTNHLSRSPTMATPAESAAPPSTSNTGNLDAPIDDVDNQLPPLPNPLPKLSPDFIHCLPPQTPEYRKYSVFLAGSIEMGKAIQWQQHMGKRLQDLPITICNPRRGHWDPTVTPEEKDESFRTQVKWELGALESVSVICFFFDTNTKSPVTMLELGLWAKSGKVVVCCNKKFHRAGNVHITCRRYGVPFVQSFEELVPLVRKTLWDQGLRKNEEGKLVNEEGHEIENKGETVEVAAEKTGVLVGEGGQCLENNLTEELIDPFATSFIPEEKVGAHDTIVGNPDAKSKTRFLNKVRNALN